MTGKEEMAVGGSGYAYMVRKDEDCPVLIHFRSGCVETVRPREDGEWVRTPRKDSILEGSGDFVWYDDISGEEDMCWEDLVRERWEKDGE